MEIKFNLKFTLVFKFINVCSLFKSGKVIDKTWKRLIYLDRKK